MDDSMDVNFPEDKVVGLDKILQSLDPIVVQLCGEEINNSESDLYGKVEAVLALLEGLSFEEQRLFPISVQEVIFGENGQSDCRLISRRLGDMSGPLTVSHIILAACETSMLLLIAVIVFAYFYFQAHLSILISLRPTISWFRNGLMPLKMYKEFKLGCDT
jgi:hypothetical protein